MSKKIHGIILFGNKEELLKQLYDKLDYFMVLYRIYDLKTIEDIENFKIDGFDSMIIIEDEETHELAKQFYKKYHHLKTTFLFTNLNEAYHYKNVIIYRNLLKDLLSFLDLNNYEGLIEIDENDIISILKNSQGHIVSDKLKNFDKVFARLVFRLKHPSLRFKNAKNAIVCLSICNQNIKLSKINGWLQMIKILNPNVNIIFGIKYNDKTNEIIVISA